ncbi:MAG: hypothetical protein IJ719_08235 [Clostridia bacterium]|nr:hypothetical protein [Clostridia bacterium]
MKKYYISRSDFANTYSLVWADETTKQPAEGWERITRKEAITYCIRERDRRKYDQMFSGYADAYIWPYGIEMNEYPRTGYIVE